MARRRLRPLAVDGLVAAGLFVLGVVSARFFDGPRQLDVLGYGLIVVACAAVVLRRVEPVVSVLVTAASVALYLGLSYPYGWVMATLALAIYSVARHRRLVEAAGWSLLSLALLSIHLLTNPAALNGPVGLVPVVAWISVPFTIGLARRLVLEAAAATRRERDRRLVDDERLRIAQEVHDIIGHGLAAIQLQADVALHLEPSASSRAHEALHAISRSSAAALAELRSTLDQIGSREGSVARSGTIGVDQLTDLAQRVETAGVRVVLAITGTRRPLPAAVDLAAYRIVQESLTNVLKHAPERQAEATVEFQPKVLTLTVVSPDRSSGPPVEGFGIGGMRHRVEECGGTFDVRTGDGRFVVRAVLPADGDEHPAPVTDSDVLSPAGPGTVAPLRRRTR